MHSPTASEQPSIKIECEGQIFHLKHEQKLKLRQKSQLEKSRCQPKSLNKHEKKHATLPEIKVGIVPIENAIPHFKMPHDYIQPDKEESELTLDGIEYDIDGEDLEWLHLENDRRKQMKLPALTNSKLEEAIDLLEKESLFQQIKSGNPSNTHGVSAFVDNDAPCCICNDGEDSNANQIIFCDMCNIAVHQECYGVPYIPEGQWLCRRCQLSPSTPVHCVLCPHTSGAFKQTQDGRWVHVLCAIYIAEVHFSNIVFLEPVENVDLALKRRARLTCLVCKRKKAGACLQCSKRNCTRSFHVTCALFSGMKMIIKEEKRSSDNVTINRYVFCHQHSENGDIENMAAWKRSVNQKISNARKILQNTVKDKLEISIPVVPQQKIGQIAEKLEVEDFSEIYYYWLLKRKSRFGVPLLRRLQVYHNPKLLEPSQNNITKEFKSSKELPNELAQYKKLRHSLERVRLLCELVKKREKHKQQLFSSTLSILTTSLRPLPIIMRDALEKLSEKDYQNIFTQPVSEEEVPGYGTIITNPMDFKTMKEKLDRGEYKKISDFNKDFNLIISNCLEFNRENLYFWKYGKRISQIGQKIIRQAEDSEENLNLFNKLFNQVGQISMLSQDDLSTISEELKAIKQKPGSSRKRTAPKEGKNSDIQTSRTNGKKGIHHENKQKSRSNSKLAHGNPLEGKNQQETPRVVKQRRKKKDGPPNKKQQLSMATPHKNLFMPEVSSQHEGENKNNGNENWIDEKIELGGEGHRRSLIQPKKLNFSFDCLTTTDLSSAASDDPQSSSADEIPNNIHNTANKKRKHVLVQQKLRFTRQTKNEEQPLNGENGFDEGLSNNLQFKHNDIVWAPLDPNSKAMLPARVIDMRMRNIDDDFALFNKALLNKPEGSNVNNHTFIAFFDRHNSSKWVMTNKLRHCTFGIGKNQQLPESFSKAPGVNEALIKAKQFWDSIMTDEK